MEGMESQTPITASTDTVIKASRRSVEVENDEHDSGCERSPTNLSPSGAQYKTSTDGMKTYNRVGIIS